MKKILTLVCAGALVAGANAQVQQARQVGSPIKVKAMTEVVSPIQMDQVQGSAKADKEDTIYSEAIYHSETGRVMMGPVATGRQGVTLDQMVQNGEPIDWIMGTGWANSIYGSGEIGLSFDFSENGWFYNVGGGRQLRSKSVVGVIASISRTRSTSEYNAKETPLYFKLYNSMAGQVKTQYAYTDFTSNQGVDPSDIIAVNHPVDRDRYLCTSNTIYIPYEEPEGLIMFGYYGARFEKPGTVGDSFCISAMFPNTHTEEDLLWNTSLVAVYNESEALLTSENPGSTYVVYDCEYQEMWGQRISEDEFEYARTREDLEWMLYEPEAQPNETSIIVPMCTWNWTDQNGNRTGERMDEEPFLRVILSDVADIERGAAYDKYVEVKINPAIDYTVLAATDRIQNVEIYNTNGKLVKTQVCNNNIETISLSGLTSGMYIAKVTTEAGVANKKIMVR